MNRNDKLPNPQLGYKGTWGRFDFGAYEHQEYPKWVRKGKVEALVQSQREELDFLANTDGEVTEVETSIHPIEAERNDLARQTAEQQSKLSEQEKEIARLREELAAVAKGAKPAAPGKSA